MVAPETHAVVNFSISEFILNSSACEGSFVCIHLSKLALQQSKQNQKKERKKLSWSIIRIAEVK
jgi:hypothetical protein